MTTQCPNCFQAPVVGHPENSCVLAALIQCLRDREKTDEARLQHLHANCDVAQLWDSLGPILDALEDGDYLINDE